MNYRNSIQTGLNQKRERTEEREKILVYEMNACGFGNGWIKGYKLVFSDPFLCFCLCLVSC